MDIKTFLKIKQLFWLVLFMLIVFSYACDGSILDESDNKQTQTYQILFIGNSYTASNNLTQLISNIALINNINIQTQSITPGGYNFYDHAENSSTLNLINSKQWDFVILQNQSQIPGWKPAAVLNSSVPHTHESACQINHFI
ncbi:MAG: hypothetical protein HRU38_16270 [Saccharospirillaceae bacterium]|nr:hypothetical protein [Pseudomonadales bacterium]NRB80198.1 hypothetical protein [Saccharospirillaceae bacterium]